MTTDASKVKDKIKLCSKFFDQDEVSCDDIENLSEFLDLPIHSCKYITKKEAEAIGKILDIKSIDDASKLNKETPFESFIETQEDGEDLVKTSLKKEKLKNQIEELKEKFPKIEVNLIKTITISTLIKDIKKEKSDLKKETQKVVVVGLDNAGKTAILTKFGGRLGISELASLKPTKGVNRQFIEGKHLDLLVWDFGGQEGYRSNYFKKPEKYFLQIDLLIYVIDVQDTDKFEESLEYFEKILNTLNTLEESPFIMVFIHKFDPDIKNDSTIQLSAELLRDSIDDLFTTNSLDYDIYLTSIFSLISNEPEFAHILKDIMKNNRALTDPTVRKLEGFAKVLEENMNLVIRLSESLSQQLDEIDNRLRAIESGAFNLAQAGIPIEIKTSEQFVKEKEERQENARSQVLGELKDLFAKKRSLEP